MADIKSAIYEAHCEQLGYKFIRFDATKPAKVYFICKCGNSMKNGVQSFLKKTPESTCLKCANIKNRIDATYVNQCFEEQGCVLLDEYTNRETLMEYICKCGNESKITWNHFVEGKRCKKCMADKKRQTSQKNYGVDNPAQSPIVQAKIAATSIKNYGTPYAMQNPDYFHEHIGKLSRKKPYRTPKGKTLMIQGYEDKCLNDLFINEGFKESDIVVGKQVPSQTYVYPLDKPKTRVWHPDIYIKSMDRLIEVKSDYTYNTKPGPEEVKQKIMCSAKDAELRVYHCNGTILFRVIHHVNAGVLEYLEGRDKYVLGEKMVVPTQKSMEKMSLDLLPPPVPSSSSSPPPPTSPSHPPPESN